MAGKAHNAGSMSKEVNLGSMTLAAAITGLLVTFVPESIVGVQKMATGAPFITVALSWILPARRPHWARKNGPKNR